MTKSDIVSLFCGFSLMSDVFGVCNCTICQIKKWTTFPHLVFLYLNVISRRQQIRHQQQTNNTKSIKYYKMWLNEWNQCVFIYCSIHGSHSVCLNDACSDETVDELFKSRLTLSGSLWHLHFFELLIMIQSYGPCLFLKGCTMSTFSTLSVFCRIFTRHISTQWYCWILLGSTR